MCVRAVVAVAPCQCFSPGGNQITSPGRICSIELPHRWASPQPAVTMSVWPSGCVCQAVRAPGSNVTLAPRTRAGSGAWNSGSMRTAPVKESGGPLPDGCEPLRLISIVPSLRFVVGVGASAAAGPAVARAASPAVAAIVCLRVIIRPPARLLASNLRTTAGGVYLDFKTAHPVSGGYLAAAPLGE